MGEPFAVAPAAAAAAPSGPCTGSRPHEWLGRLLEVSRRFAAQESHLRHDAINLACLAAVVAAFPLTWRVAYALPLPLGLPLAALVFGTLIFSLFTLVVHEAAHNQFLIVRSPALRRWLNDVAGWSVCLFFLRDYGGHWREGHALHHRRPLAPEDPQNCEKYVYEKSALCWKLVKVWLVPLYEFELYRLWMPHLDDRCPKVPRRGPKRTGLRVLGFVLAWTAVLFVPMSVAPVWTTVAVLMAIKWGTTLNFVKSSLEHGGGYASLEEPLLKTRGLTFPGKSLVFPFCITPYHWEHHLNPSIPWYRLPRFRRAIAPRIPESSRDLIYTPGPQLLERVLLP